MTGEGKQQEARAGRLSRNCYVNEHLHCGGQIKFANADNTDDCFPCDCPCHAARQASQPSTQLNDDKDKL